jgi:hypothetical protein
MTEMLKWYRRPLALPDSGAGKSKSVAAFYARFDFDRRAYQYFDDTLNCAYSTSNAIYTGATGGYPVGDLNWFPSRYAAWKSDAVSDVPMGEGLPAAFTLAQNYPNPFNPATTITFTLTKSGLTTLVVFNILGQKVATPVAGVLTAGPHDVRFDGAGLASGVYFYRLESGGLASVKKMMLMR